MLRPIASQSKNLVLTPKSSRLKSGAKTMKSPEMRPAFVAGTRRPA